MSERRMQPLDAALMSDIASIYNQSDERLAMTPDEYIEKLTRLDALMGADPEAESEAGKELSALADELQAYEQATFPNLYPSDGDFMDTGAPPDDEPPELAPGTP